MERMENGDIRAITLLNRVGDVHMEGTYGYTSRQFREGGGVLLTATSTVKEFTFDRMEEVNLPHYGKMHCFIGTDYYGREMTLPIKRIRGLTMRDTEDQGRLKGLNWCLRAYEELCSPNITEEQRATVDAYYQTLRDKQVELVAAGVTEYEPRRATEDEL